MMLYSLRSLFLLFFVLTIQSQSAFADLNHTKIKPFIYSMNPIADPKVGDNTTETVRLSLSDASREAYGQYTLRDLRCLSEAIYYEARGEGVNGATAVAEVVLNRAESDRFPDTVCGVVYDKYKNICQFSFVCNGAMNKAKNSTAWEWSKKLARDVIEGHTKIVSNGALFFHAHYVKPSWAHKMYRTARIGAHSFYKPKR